MASYAIVQNGVVTNVIEWDGTSKWQTPAGVLIEPIPAGMYAGIGSTYSNGAFSPPPQPKPIMI